MKDRELPLSDVTTPPVNTLTYSDGEAEDVLLELFDENQFEEKIGELLQNNPTWPLRYHLSPLRENLLSWYEFNNNGIVLEVGAGCGALTGLLCDRLRRVVAVELSQKRAEIIRRRHRSRANLSVLSGNVHQLSSNEVFDYVTCIGVLEYAGRYTASVDSALDFLSQLKQLLRPQGTLVLAIENRFGIKYWAGAPEDHTGRLFDSIEGYPNAEGIATYGKQELISLLNAAGFNNLSFYYPLPDYKLPTEIFSDEYLPSREHRIRAGIFPSPNYTGHYGSLFDEQLAIDCILSNRRFDFFANSYLVFAS